MADRVHPEPTGQAKITPAFNLPCRYVLHTVGPIIDGRVTKKGKELLVACYRSCLELQRKMTWKAWRSAAFPRVSFIFPMT